MDSPIAYPAPLSSALGIACGLLLLIALVPRPAAAGTLIVANKAEATVSLIDVDSGEVRATLPTGTGPHEVAVSPDGRLAVVADYGGGGAPGSTLTLIDVPGALVVRTIDLGEYRRPHKERIPLGFHSLDLFEKQLDPIEFTMNMRLEMLW
jgi:hypothetical protein